MTINILIVDDSRTVHAVIEKTLKIAGVPINEVFHAHNGAEGLEMIANKWIDIIFADLNMPVMTGFEMIDKLLEDGLMNTIPVVVVSTEANPARIHSLEDKGIRAYLRKPFRPEQFREVVNEVLGKSDE